MKVVLIAAILLLGFSACASKKHNPYGSYDRSVNASEKAQKELAEDTK